MKKEKLHLFYNDIYPIVIAVSFCKDLKSALERIIDLNDKPIDDSWDEKTNALVYSDCKIKETNEYCVGLFFKDKNKYDLIAHEVCHAAKNVWEHVSEKTPSNEADAYLHEYIYRCCLKAMKEK